MAQDKSLHTKDKIFNAALKVFSEKGFSGATTSEIAREAGVAEGSIFRYYKTKKDILRGVMLEYVNRVEEFADTESMKKIIKEHKNEPIEKILKLMALNRYKIFEKYYPMNKVIFYEIQFHEDIKKIYCDKIIEKESDIVKFLFEEIGIDKEVYEDTRYQVAVRIFKSMLTGAFFQRKNELIKEAYIPIEEEIDMVIDVFFNGINHIWRVGE